MNRPSATWSPAMPWNVGSTPNTVGESANGFGISFDGVNRLRAVDAPTPSTVDLMTRMSARVKPGETCRSRWNACWSGAGFDSTIRLRTPIASITAITCCCAPAPIESIATTAATPKIMPSIVSSERSLWAKRLSTPIASVGSRSRLITGGLRARPPAWQDRWRPACWRRRHAATDRRARSRSPRPRLRRPPSSRSCRGP